MADHKIQISIDALDNASSTINRVKSNAEDLENETKNLSRIKINGDGFKDMAKGADKAGDEVEDTKDDVDSLKGSLDGLKGMIAGAFSFMAIKSFVSSCLEASASVELLKKGLSFQIGEEQTEKLIKNIQTIGEQSAYDSNDLMGMAKQWVNIGSSADDAVKKISTIVDVGSAFGLTREQIEGANLALTQMQMSGKIGQQDMMQLINAGIPAWQLLSDAMGIPVGTLKEMSSQGKLTGDAINQLFDAMQDKTQGATQGMNDTLAAAFSNLDETVHNTMANVGDIISQGFDVKGVLSGLSSFVGQFQQDMAYIKGLMQNMNFAEAFSKEYGLIGDCIELIGNMAVAYMAVRTAQLLVAATQAIINALSGNWGNLLLLTIVGAIMLIAEHWDELSKTVKQWCDNVKAWFNELCAELSKAWQSYVDYLSNTWDAIKSGVQGVCHFIEEVFEELTNAIIKGWQAYVNYLSSTWSAITGFIQGRCKAVEGFFESAGSVISNAWHATVDGIVNTFQAGIDKVRNIWKGVVDTLSHPIDAVVNISRNVTEHVSSGGSSGSNPAKARFGMATGGIVGGHIPMLANGGTTRKGTPAIIGEAGPEAVLPLRKEIFDKIGAGLAKSLKEGGLGGAKSSEIMAKIKATADTKDLSELEKIFDEADKKVKEIGKQLKAFHDYEQQATEQAQKYADTGEATLEFKQKEADLIAKNNKEELDALRQKYEAEKATALANAKDVADNKVRIEQDAQNAIAQVQMQAEEKAFSYSRALAQAKQAEDKANNAQSLADYVNIMSQKDEITGQSYAAILGHENELSEQRQIAHDNMILNATSWADYMTTLTMQVGQTIQDNLSEGLTQWLMGTKSIQDAFSNLANTIIQTFINGALKKWISSLGIIKTLNDSTEKSAIASTTAQTTALLGKAAAQAKVAVASLIAAMPFTAYTAGATVATQMGIGSEGASILHKADGGPIFGPGTSTSDSIPALLSNGEYVINADAAAQIGRTTLDALNSGHYPAFADGGNVGSSEPAPARNVNLSISTLDASSFDDFLSRGGMDKIKQKLFDNTREFSTDAGVW